MYFFSAENNAFYPISLKELYIEAGSWPIDLIAVDDATYNQFIVEPSPVGKIMAANEAGYPIWTDSPEITKEDIIEARAYQKQQLLKEASNNIDILQDASDCMIVTDDEKAQLLTWKVYRVLLNRVDISDIDFAFPEKPNLT